MVVSDPLSSHTTQKWHHWEAHLENLLAQMMSWFETLPSCEQERRSATFRESQNHKLQLGFFPLPSPSRAKFQQQWLHNLFDVTFCELLTILSLSGAARLHSFKVLPEYNRTCWIPTPTFLETKTHLVYTYTYTNANIFSYSPLFLHFQYLF